MNDAWVIAALVAFVVSTDTSSEVDTHSQRPSIPLVRTVSQVRRTTSSSTATPSRVAPSGATAAHSTVKGSPARPTQEVGRIAR